MPARPRSARRGGEESPAHRAAPERVLIGRALLGGRLQPVEIGIDGEGRIDRVARTIRGGERTDLGEAVLVPAATDLHVHFREPGGDRAVESLATGSLQAAYGGVGLVADMPNTRPPVESADDISAKAAHARGRLAVDVAIVAAARTPGQVRAAGTTAAAFKLFLSPTTGITGVPPEAALPPLLGAVAATGLALSVHAEAPERFLDPSTADSLVDWDQARPLTAEAAAVRSTIGAAPPDLRLHIAHVTGAAVAALLRASGHSFEATPHHLLLSSNGRGAWAKVNPPLRDEATRIALLWEFIGGRVPILASDHAPHPSSEKSRPFREAPSGVPGVETMLPLFLELVRRGELPLEVLQAAAADRPARWLGVPVGRLAVGHRANLLAIDFRGGRRKIEGRRLHGPVGWTPFEGFDAVFPRHHLRGGEPLIEEYEFVGGTHGNVVRPDYVR